MDDHIQSIILGRRSIRRYQDRPIPQNVLENILTAATWAPSAHNRQPWRFMVITSPEVRRSLAVAMGTRLRADLAADNTPPEMIEKDANRSHRRITGSPALILVCLSLTAMDHYPDPKRANYEYLLAVQSTALAAQNLLLAAHAEGLGGCWMCAPLFCPDVVTAELSLPTDWQPQTLITLGYPAETRQSTRQPLETRVLWR